MNVKRDIRFRVYVAFSAICLLGVMIVAKAAWIQVKEGPELRMRAQEMNLRTDTLTAERGNIYSEDGTLLSSTIPQFDVHLDLTIPKPDTFARYLDTLSRGLATITGKGSAADWKAKLQKGQATGSRYFEVGKNLAYYQFQAVRQLPILNKGQRRGGLIFETKNKRVAPYGALASRTIGKSGYVWKGVGKDARLVKSVAGLEATCDSLLSGIDGNCIRQRIVGNRWTTIDGSVVEPQNGRDIVTTLDMRIQDVAHHALQSVLEQYNCQQGTCIVMEVSTGKVKALANLGRDSATGKFGESINYATVLAEPGSTFKMATLAALLKDGYINTDDLVNCAGGAKVFGNRTMHDSHHGLGTMPIREAFAHSSNVGMATLAFEHYAKNPEKFIKHIEELHLLDRTGIELAGEPKPVVIRPSSKHWNNTILPWMATGYGVMVTPLHTCMLYNAVANNGRMMKPYLIHSVREYGRDVKVFDPVVLNESIVDSAGIRQLRSCAEEVVLSGTGKHIQSPNYRIAGKTGTAQVADKGITYRMGVYQGTFVGYFPADKPRYTICVVIRTRPHAGSYYGGTLAAPVFRMVADKIFASDLGSWAGPLDSFARLDGGKMVSRPAAGAVVSRLMNSLGRPALSGAGDTEIVGLSVDSAHRLQPVRKTAQRGLVPDVVGMGLRDAIYLLEKQGLNVQIQGSGTVQSQSLPAGSAIQKGQSVLLQLHS
ncbi:MAG: PASTA domain-containing protein [Sphingobacteriales bacterium]|nr:MAG: PASTA domain-containing protein [Sphingobacteriales bacterium]